MQGVNPCLTNPMWKSIGIPPISCEDRFLPSWKSAVYNSAGRGNCVVGSSPTAPQRSGEQIIHLLNKFCIAKLGANGGMCGWAVYLKLPIKFSFYWEIKDGVRYSFVYRKKDFF